ncbi:MAG TPA: M48 family metalloprotease [Candidatus Binataceae bacterium]|nr:M48 family metalloprotease [Candidatus Binataceae bacterium]
MATDTNNFWALERVNRRRRVARLVVSQILVFAALGSGFDLSMGAVRFAAGHPAGFPWCTAAGLIFGIGQTMRTYYGGPGMVLGSVGAFPVEGNDAEDELLSQDKLLPGNKVLIDVTREMALAARLPAPRLYMIDDSAPNSFAIGRNFDDSVICVTRGLVDMMDREELQSVIAHEMAHIRSYDMRLMMLVTATMLGNLGSLSQNLFAPINRATTALLSREREYLADAAAVEFTRNPAGMIRALEKIRDAEAPLKRGAPPHRFSSSIPSRARVESMRDWPVSLCESARRQINPKSNSTRKPKRWKPASPRSNTGSTRPASNRCRPIRRWRSESRV